MKYSDEFQVFINGIKVVKSLHGATISFAQETVTEPRRSRWRIVDDDRRVASNRDANINRDYEDYSRAEFGLL